MNIKNIVIVMIIVVLLLLSTGIQISFDNEKDKIEHITFSGGRSGGGGFGDLYSENTTILKDVFPFFI